MWAEHELEEALLLDLLIEDLFNSKYGVKLAFQLKVWKNMKETSEELPNFSIGMDLLGPDPTSNKNKAEKNSQVARFANLSKPW